MPALQIPISQPALTGPTPVNFAIADPVNGNSFANDGYSHLILDNKQGTIDVNVRISVPGKIDRDLTVNDRVYLVPAGQVICTPTLDRGLYNQPDGTVSFIVDSPLVVAVLSSKQ